MKGSKASVLTVAEKCKNILASNWQGRLNTIKADAKGSKEEIYTSTVKYFLKKGKPYIWIPEKDLHNVLTGVLLACGHVSDPLLGRTLDDSSPGIFTLPKIFINTIIDERGSFAVSSSFPDPLGSLFRSIKKLPARVALTGDVLPLNNEKVKLAAESLRDIISFEKKIIKESSYSVSGILSSSDLGSTPRSENLEELLDENKQYVVYRFTLRSCIYIDGNGGTHGVKVEDFEASKSDPLSPFLTSLINGINQSEARRRALVLFCITNLNKHAKDAFLLSVDRKGFDVLGKVLGPVSSDGSREYQWKEFRIAFKDEARDVEAFCRQLVQMEEEALKTISGFSGL